MSFDAELALSRLAEQERKKIGANPKLPKIRDLEQKLAKTNRKLKSERRWVSHLIENRDHWFNECSRLRKEIEREK